jgi:predicted small metal-binding protein
MALRRAVAYAWDNMGQGGPGPAAIRSAKAAGPLTEEGALERRLRLSCKELGGDCGFVAEGEDAEEVKRHLLAHMSLEHRERTSRMSRDEREALDVRIDRVLGRR